MAQLPPIPYRMPLLDTGGFVNRNWAQFFEALLQRVGGTGDVMSNADLETQSELELGAQTSSVLATQGETMGLTPVGSLAVMMTLSEFAPSLESMGAGGDLTPRFEPGTVDFILGEIT